MSDLIKNMVTLSQNKDAIIKKIKEIDTAGVSKTQAQNLREYAAQTQSIEEILLYIEYQCARERRLQDAGDKLTKMITDYQREGIDVIRYILGTFARWVLIKSK